MVAIILINLAILNLAVSYLVKAERAQARRDGRR